MNLPALIETYIAAYNARDADQMIACLAEDVVFRNISDGELTAEASGRAAFEEMARAAIVAFSARRQTVKNAITVADTTLVELDYSATLATDLPNGWKAGQVIALAGASLFRTRAGQIVEIIDQS